MKGAIDYLDVALEEYQVDRDVHLFLVALRTVVESQNGIAALAKRTCTQPKALLEMLSGEEMPRIDMLSSVLTALGGRLSIKPLKMRIPMLTRITRLHQEKTQTRILKPPPRAVLSVN